MLNEKRYNSGTHLLYTTELIDDTLRHGIGLANSITYAVGDDPDDCELGWILCALFVEFGLQNFGYSNVDGLTFGLLIMESNQYVLTQIAGYAASIGEHAWSERIEKARDACLVPLREDNQGDVLGEIFEFLEAAFYGIEDYYASVGLVLSKSLKNFKPRYDG